MTISGGSIGVRASSVAGIAVSGESTFGRAVTGVVQQGSVPGNPNILTYGVYSGGRFAASGTKSFQIDHPQDPGGQYLNHYSIEAPEPFLMYRGTAILGKDGAAMVALPGYFDSINRDPHYQLTAVGGAAPELHIAEEVRRNRFKIAGGSPGLKVAWTVTAVRNDRWVQAYGAPIELEKPPELQGKYLHPELYGHPLRDSIFVAEGVIAAPE